MSIQIKAELEPVETTRAHLMVQNFAANVLLEDVADQIDSVRFLLLSAL